MADETTTLAADGVDHSAEAAGHAVPESVGMPQLNFESWPNQIFWLVIALLAIHFILTRVALPRIATVLAERAGSVTNDIAAAEELKLKAQEAEAAYNQALADARSEAQKIIAEAKAEMQVELDAANQKADAEIAARTAESEKAISEIRANALASVEEVAREAAAEIVAVLGGDSKRADIDAAVAAQMKGA